ncbi:MAG: yphB [Bacillales bacterium]|jgi:uncharacterized membrane protein YeaQ/YmgE (transglycosylase-associated protein family)|nr:yphB [Bacillales bacterium]
MSGNFTEAILFGTIIGTISRLYMMRTDYRQYPTYLHGKIVHIALGIIAAGLGSIVVPAILSKNYTAITFLTLAASQFRDVRNMERNTMTELDSYELVPRGKTYIEGIAVAFESRNYLVILTSIITSGTYLYGRWEFTVVSVMLLLVICKSLMSGKKIKDLASIDFVQLRFEGSGLYVGNIYIMNIGHPERQKEILEMGMGFLLTPKNFNFRNSLANLGQRQAILHDTATSLGIYRDSGTPSFTPLIKRDLKDGKIGIFLLPQLRNVQKAIEVIGGVPVLENAIKIPSERIDKE